VARWRNTPTVAFDVTVEDVAGREKDFTLEKNGFMFGQQHTKVLLTTDDLGDVDKISKEYYPEMENWLKEVTGAPRAFVYHHTTRISTSKYSLNNFDKDKDSKKVPHQPALMAAHLDLSSFQAGHVLHKNFPKETEALLHGRVMLVNAWRSIKPVYKHPFGVADASTVPHQDLVLRHMRIFKDINQSLSLKYSAKHKWHYKFAQQPEDVLIFKQFDNYGKARACPHTAFDDKEYEDAAPRESIELRALLMWPDYEPVLEPKM